MPQGSFVGPVVMRKIIARYINGDYFNSLSIPANTIEYTYG